MAACIDDTGLPILIINADDLGISPERTRGIFESYTKGAVSSASLLVNLGASSLEAAAGIPKGLGVGLHLNLTEGKALSDQSELLGKYRLWNALVDGDVVQAIDDLGCAAVRQKNLFQGMIANEQAYQDDLKKNGPPPRMTLYEAIVGNEIKERTKDEIKKQKSMAYWKEQERIIAALRALEPRSLDAWKTFIRREIGAQLDWFEKHVKQPCSHVDGHNHVHIIPLVATILAEEMAKRRIRWTRMPVDPSPYLESPFQQRVVRFASKSAALYRQHKIRFSDQFIGLNLYGYRGGVDRLVTEVDKALKREDPSVPGGDGPQSILRDPIVELMTHPGYRSEMGDSFATSRDRDYEMTVLQDRKLTLDLELRVHVKNFHQLL